MRAWFVATATAAVSFVGVLLVSIWMGSDDAWMKAFVASLTMGGGIVLWSALDQRLRREADDAAAGRSGDHP